MAAFLEAMRKSRLLEAEQLNEIVRADGQRYAEPLALAKELVRRGILTPFQVNQLLQGNGSELVLGNYRVLERLGEGGMGTVYKAQHRLICRIVALKVLRKDRLAKAAALKRFEREIKASAQLAHPNIVTAYDAGQVGDTHFFTMEYVQGTDLGKLCKEQGPLPVADCCDYIRQAALGLQHAFERGMVHRDIKPSNLLLSTSDSVVKILDLGLARIAEGDDPDTTNNLTQAGKVVGTIDYLAPEQAINSHRVDIRADLYSLGCTFYELLSGRVPFRRGSPMEKLARHRWEEPRALEKLRPEIPAPVVAVIRRLMAKKPEDRFQTPADLASTLEQLGGSGSHSGVSGPFAAAAAPAALLAPADVPVAIPVAVLDKSSSGRIPIAKAIAAAIPAASPAETHAASRPAPSVASRGAGRRRLLLLAIVGVAMLLGIVLTAIVMFRMARALAPHPTRGSLIPSAPRQQVLTPLLAGAARYSDDRSAFS